MDLDSLISDSSEHLNNCSSSNINNSPKTSTIVNFTNDTSNTSNSTENIQMNEEECKFIINVIKSNDVLPSQNEATLLKIVKKYEKHFIPLMMNDESIDLNTQIYIDLLLQRATVDLQKHQEVSKNQTIEHMDSDDIIIATPPSTSTKCNSKQNNQDVLTDQDQDPDLIAFKTMCDALLTISAVDNVTLNNNANTEKNNQENPLIFKQVNEDVLSCISNTKCVPGTSNSNRVSTCYKSDTDITNNLAHKKRIFKNLTLDSSEKSSPEYLSQKQYSCQNKKFKYNSSKNTLKNNDLIKVNTFVRKEEKGTFYCAPGGKIHQDMLAFIDKQKYDYDN